MAKESKPLALAVAARPVRDKKLLIAGKKCKTGHKTAHRIQISDVHQHLVSFKVDLDISLDSNRCGRKLLGLG